VTLDLSSVNPEGGMHSLLGLLALSSD
jgi:hypothetical protein